MSNKKKHKKRVRKMEETMDVLAIMKDRLHSKSIEEMQDITLADWAHRWLQGYCPNIKQSTLESYTSAVDNHIIRVFRDKKLFDITDDDVQMFILSLMQGVGLKESLHTKTIKNIHGVLHICLQTAYEMKMIPYNPAEHTKLPKVKRPVIVPLNDEQIKAFLDAIRGHVYEPIYKLALFTGMRQGEILGLTNDCFNFSEGYIRLYQ